mgnify:FL=1|jgi:hypothetical protein
MKITRRQLEDSRRRGCRVYGYKKAFCDLHSCCEKCDRRIRLLCRLICKIENIQEKIILRSCPPEGEEGT